MNQSKDQRLVILDGLRGFAAILVMFYHVGTLCDFRGIAGAGYLAVDLFFILSGFVLTLAFEQRFTSGMHATDFLKLRVHRLWPALAFGALIGGVGYWLREENWQVIPMLILSLILMPSLNPRSIFLFELNSPQWSLFYEILINLLHAALIYRISNKLLTFLVFLSASLLTWAVFARGTIAHLGLSITDFPFGMARVGFSYGLGILFARHWPRVQRSSCPCSWLTVLLPITAILICGILPESWWIDVMATIAILPLLFFLTARSQVPNFVQPWLQRLGMLSYPLYAVHYPILQIALWVDREYLPQVPRITLVALATIVALAVAQLVAVISVDRVIGCVPVHHLRLTRRSRAGLDLS